MLLYLPRCTKKERDYYIITQCIISKCFQMIRHVIFFAVLLQLTQQTHFVTPDKKDSIPPVSASESTHFNKWWQQTVDEELRLQCHEAWTN